MRCLEAGAIPQLAKSLPSLRGAGGLVVHACNLRARKVEAGGYKFKIMLKYEFGTRPCLKKLGK